MNVYPRPQTSIRLNSPGARYEPRVWCRGQDLNLRLGRSRQETVSPVSDVTIFSRVLSLASPFSEEQAELSRVLFNWPTSAAPRPSPVELKPVHKTLLTYSPR